LVVFGTVAGLHLALILLLLGDRLPDMSRPRSLVSAALVSEHPPAPKPVPHVVPMLQAPAAIVPLPDIKIAESAPPKASPLRAPAQAAPSRATQGDGLEMEVATAPGGGALARAALDDFEAGVKARIEAGKRQPVLAKELRNTCLITYTISIDRSGRMLSYRIDPCTVAAINEAARAAISRAGPFAPPPDLGASRTDVHGSLVFEP